MALVINKEQVIIKSIIMQQSAEVYRSDSLDKWRCSKCFFDNLQLLPICEICQAPREDRERQTMSSEKNDKIEAGICCPDPLCRHINPLSRDICEKCRKELFPDSEDDGSKKKKVSTDPKKELAACRSCGYQNDPDNSSCVNCEKPFRAKRIPKKPARAARKFRMGHGMSSACPTCAQPLAITDYATGETDICMNCQKDHPTTLEKSLCLFCDQKLKFSEAKAHDEDCEQRKKFFRREGNSTYDRCTDLQYDTMVYMQRKCEKLHYRKEKQLIERIKKLGYTVEDLENLHHYIIHYAPIIIHMHVNTHFHFFLKDTHYRNQFETNKSSGSLSHSARTGWESRMFDKKHNGATGYERVKYGTMNFTNDPRGVGVCRGYGESYFLLKEHVRDRCTITDMDSSSASATLGTFRFIFHVLMKLSDAQLNCAFQGSKGKQMKSNVIGTYKQIQIHGPVEFSKDIERVYISKNQLKMGDAKALLEQVKTFCSKHSIEYEMFNNQPIAGMYGIPAAPADSKVQDRIVGDQKELTEADLEPPPPPPASVYGGGIFGGGGFLFGAPGAVPAFGGGFFGAPPAAAFGASHFSFGVPVPFTAPKPVKKKEYGVDYI